MKIPENFKKKYSLVGDSYDPKNVDAALSELLTVSGRLYKENADLKAEIARLKEQSSQPQANAVIDTSKLEALIKGLETRIEAVKVSVDDALCVANDAANSAKEASDSADSARNAAEKSAQIAERIEEKLDDISIAGGHDDVLPLLLSEDDGEEEETQEIIPVTEEIDAPEQIEEIEELEEIEKIEEGGIAEDECNMPEEEEAVIIAEAEILEAFEDEPEVIEGSEAIEEPADVEEIEPAKEEKAKEIEEIGTVEAAEEIEEIEEEKEPEAVDAIADDLIRTAGLDSEPEEIEPAAPVGDDEISQKLAEMYSAPAEETTPKKTEEKPAQPANFNDMKSALDAIRARLKK